MSDNRERRIDEIAKLPLPQFLDMVMGRMMSAGYKPGITQITRVDHTRIAEAIFDQNRRVTADLMAEGLARRNQSRTYDA